MPRIIRIPGFGVVIVYTNAELGTTIAGNGLTDVSTGSGFTHNVPFIHEERSWTTITLKNQRESFYVPLHFRRAGLKRAPARRPKGVSVVGGFLRRQHHTPGSVIETVDHVWFASRKGAAPDYSPQPLHLAATLGGRVRFPSVRR